MASEKFEKGLEVRKAWLGEAYVERNLGKAEEFMMPMQEFITESCWGTAWARPGLPRKTRSMLVMAMLVALDRQHELKAHVGAAYDNGTTLEEIREVLLQAATYCGVPAGLDAFRSAREALKERGVDLNKI